MKRLAFLGGVAGVGLVALLAVQRGHAADHLDTPALAASPMSDINDLYAWMDGTKLNLAMSVSPGDTEDRAFGPDVQYVFHVHSKRGLGVNVAGTGTEARIVCTFDSNTRGRCWVLAGGEKKDYVEGDPSHPDGIESPTGKLRVFAGRRADPFFFNLGGFRATLAAARNRLGGFPQVTYDAAGCPDSLTSGDVATIMSNLGALVPGAPCSSTNRDCFIDSNVRILLVQVENDLVRYPTHKSVGVWASTHQTPSESP